MKDRILIVAFDQASTGPTGICAGWYRPGSGSEVIISRTVKGFLEILIAINDLDALRRYPFPGCPITFHPDAIVREDGYFDKRRPAAGLEIERAGGWVEAACKIAWPEAKQYQFMATVWRKMVFGHRAKADAEYWKRTCYEWATADCDLIEDHHQAEARGLLAACGETIYAKGDDES